MPYGIIVLPATRQSWHSHPYPSRSWYSIKWPRRDARLSWPSWLVTYRESEIVYRPEDGHPSKYQPGPTWVNFVRAMNAAKHYAMPQTSGSRCSSSYCLFAGLCAGVSAACQTGGLRWLGLGYQHSVGSAVVLVVLVVVVLVVLVLVLVVVSAVLVVVVTCVFAGLSAGLSAARQTGGLGWLGD